ncbi:MAG: DUF2298 domain-containing protein [Methanoregulaceae archaeon]|nr:DUF2298 domain-containing protein [Methanoregulaceae archaeon]
MMGAEVEAVSVLAWLAVLFFLQLSLWPFLRRACREFAYPVSWSVSILLFTLVSWYCGFAGLPVPLALLPFAVLLGIAAYRGEYSWEAFCRERRWVVLFLVAFGAMLEVRYVNSSISYAEKFMDHAFIASIMRIPVVPPLDPWFSGGYQNAYYYLGYWLFGTLGIVSGVPSTIVFNLALPTVFGLSAINLYAIGDLVMKRFKWLPLIGLVMFNPSFIWNFLSGKPVGSVFWDSTRTITNTINEYPLFSFTWGDVHPHVIGMFNQILLIFLLLYAWKRWGSLDTRGRGILICIAALGLGSAPAINTWDVLIYAPLILAFGLLIWYRNLGPTCKESKSSGHRGCFQEIIQVLKGAVQVSVRHIREGRPWEIAGEAWGFFLLTPPLAVLLYTPFYLQMRTQGVDGVGFVTLPTNPVEFLLVHGFFLAVLLVYCRKDIAARPYLLIIPGLVVAAGYASAGIALIPLVYLLVRKERDAVSFMAIIGLSILIVCEFLYLKDHMGDTYFRMNTVFKFYIGAWFFLATASLAIIGRWLDRIFPAAFPSRTASRVLTVLSIACLLSVPLLVPLDPPFRTSSLDGLSYLTTEHPGDLAAVTFLRTLPGNITLVEAECGDYSYCGRVSSFTGIPAVIGWPFHEFMWRGDMGGWYGQRVSDVRTIYEDPERTLPLMEKYNATLLYIGDLEREKYKVNITGLALPLIYENEGVAIYRRG